MSLAHAVSVIFAETDPGARPSPLISASRESRIERLFSDLKGCRASSQGTESST